MEYGETDRRYLYVPRPCEKGGLFSGIHSQGIVWGAEIPLLVEQIASDLVDGLGRIAFPIFAYGIAQGCVFSKNRKMYLLRLFVFAVISEVPYQLALGGYGSELHFRASNIFFTLLVGALCCVIVRFFREKKKGWIAVFPVAVLVLFAEIYGLNYGAFGVLAIVLPYCFFENRRNRLLALAGVMVFFYVVTAHFNGFSYPLQWMTSSYALMRMIFEVAGALVAVLILAFYGGEQGRKKGKYLFYVFYPAHLLLLFVLKSVIPVP